MAKTDETKITNELSKRFAHEPFISFGEYHVYPSDIFVAILIGFISWLLVRWIKRLLTAAHRSNKLTVGQMYAYSQLSKYFIFVISL